MRKDALIAAVHRPVVSVLVALLLAGAQLSPAAAQLIDFKAGIADPASSDLSWWLAQTAGLYRQQGLDVEIRSDDGNRALEALLAGRLDRDQGLWRQFAPAQFGQVR
jgi:hypothetical protein